MLFDFSNVTASAVMVVLASGLVLGFVLSRLAHVRVMTIVFLVVTMGVMYYVPLAVDRWADPTALSPDGTKTLGALVGLWMPFALGTLAGYRAGKSHRWN